MSRFKLVSLAILIGIFYNDGCLTKVEIFWLEIGRGIFAFDNEKVLGRCSSITREDFGVVIIVGFVLVDMKLFSMNEVMRAFLLGV